MDVVVEILGRATFNEEFAVLNSHAVTLDDEPVTIVPAVPAEAAGRDLRVRLRSPVQVPVHFRRFVSSANDLPGSIGTHGSHGGESQLFPFRGDETSIIIARAGVALP